jgi:hypothetical protein
MAGQDLPIETLWADAAADNQLREDKLMTGGFGSFRFGTGPQLGDVLFEVSTATSLSEVLVRVDFTATLDLTHAANFNPVNYTIAGLTVSDVDPSGNTAVILRTSRQDQIPYVVVVNATSGRIQAIGADFLDPAHAEATFDGDPARASFAAAIQSRRKVQLRFSEAMQIDDAFVDPLNYQLSRLDGLASNIQRVEQTGPDDTRGQLILAEDLIPLAYYSLQVGVLVRSQAGRTIRPEGVLLQWKEAIPRPFRLRFGSFSGEAKGGLLGAPDGQIFFSPAFGANAANSVIEIDSVRVCTRAYDVYSIPSDLGAAGIPLFTFPAAAGASDLIGASPGPPTRGLVTVTLGLLDAQSFAPGTLVAHVIGEPLNRWRNRSLVRTNHHQYVVSAEFESELFGPAARAEAGTLTTIVDQIDEWTDIINPASATPGVAQRMRSILWATAHRRGQAISSLADQREDGVLAPEDGTPEGLLVEPIDITRAAFLNDGRWGTFPGIDAALGAFRTADNQAPIGAGPTVGPFAIA